MAHRSLPTCEPESGGWQYEPPWASDALGVANASDDGLATELEAFQLVSGHSPVDFEKKEQFSQRPVADNMGAVIATQRPCSGVEEDVDTMPSPLRNHQSAQTSENVLNSETDGGHSPRIDIPTRPHILDVRSSRSSRGGFTNSSQNSSRTSLQIDLPSKTPPITRDSDDLLQTPQHHQSNMRDSRSNEAAAWSKRWQEIQSLRVDIWSRRSEIHELRVSLREKQEAKSVADDLFMLRLSMQGVPDLALQHNLPSAGQKSLEDLRRDCQEARNAYGPEEDDCNRLEDLLSRQEFKLARLEKPFYVSTEEPRPPVHLSSSPTLPSPEPEPETSSETSHDGNFGGSNYHPLVAKYLSKLGDLDLLQESLDDLFDERESLEQTRQSRHKYGLHLSMEDQSWLDNSRTEQDNIALKIKNLEDELKELKQECLEKKLIDEDGDPIDFQSQEDLQFDEEEDMNSQDQRSEYVKYPLLLPHPGIKNDEMKAYEPRPDEKSDITTSRINEWMLDCLRISPLDVNFLARTFEGWVGIGCITDQWQYAVLNIWYRDGTVKGTQAIRANTSSSLTTQAPEVSKSATDSPKKATSESNSYRLLLASAGFFSSNISDRTDIDFIVGNAPTPPRWKFNWNSD